MTHDLTTDCDTETEIGRLEESWNHKAAMDGASEGLRELAKMMAETAGRVIDATLAVIEHLAALSRRDGTLNRTAKTMIADHTGRAFRSARKAVAYYGRIRGRELKDGRKLLEEEE